jgi:hypothetical protein
MFLIPFLFLSKAGVSLSDSFGEGVKHGYDEFGKYEVRSRSSLTHAISLKYGGEIGRQITGAFLRVQSLFNHGFHAVSELLSTVAVGFAILIE